MTGRCIGAVALLLALQTGCGGSNEARSRGGAPAATPEEGEQRVPRGKIACRLHSCSPPYFCNEESGVCEMLACKASSECPYDYKCDFSINACR